MQSQREVLGSIAAEAKSPWTVLNPVRYLSVAKGASGSLRIGDDVSPIALFRFALALSASMGGDGLNCTVPLRDFAVTWDPERAPKMFDLIKKDRTDQIGKPVHQGRPAQALMPATDRFGGMTSADHPGAYAYGVATLTLDGTVLDVWYPEPRLGAAPEGDPEPVELTALAGQDAIREVHKVVVRTVIDDLQAAADRRVRRLPAAAPAVAPARRSPRPEPRRHLRPADQRRVDVARSLRRSTASRRSGPGHVAPACTCRSRASTSSPA